MRPRDEVEAAYFALLRARDELANLERFRDYLEDELRRIRRFVSEGEALDDAAPPKLRRRLVHTDAPIHDALRTRQNVIRDELKRLPDRLDAAQDFVEECERDHQTLRQAL